MQSYEEVFEIVKLIPEGKVSTYGAIAKYLGTSPRVIGWALNSSLGNKKIPAHRVVNRHGILTGKIHFATADLMQKILESEGLKIENDQIENFKSHFWDPSLSLL